MAFLILAGGRHSTEFSEADLLRGVEEEVEASVILSEGS